MKNLLILHGSFGSPDKNWYRYLEAEAIKKGYIVHVPQLEHIDRLNLEKTYKFLLKKGYIGTETTIVGHSSGATYILGILQRLPKDIVIRKAILVAGFIDDNLTKELFKVVSKIHYAKLFPDKWDWQKIRNNSRSFVFIHSKNDPYVQTRHAKAMHKKLGGIIKEFPNAYHFSVNTGGEKYKEFPEILKYID